MHHQHLERPAEGDVGVDLRAAAERLHRDRLAVHAHLVLLRVAPGRERERRAELQRDLAVAQIRRPPQADHPRRAVVRRDADRLGLRDLGAVPLEEAARLRAGRRGAVAVRDEPVAHAGPERLGELELDEVAAQLVLRRIGGREARGQGELDVVGERLGLLRLDELLVGVGGVVLGADAPGLRLVARADAGRAEDGDDGVGVDRHRAAEAVALQRPGLEVDGIGLGSVRRGGDAQGIVQKAEGEQKESFHGVAGLDGRSRLSKDGENSVCIFFCNSPLAIFSNTGWAIL